MRKVRLGLVVGSSFALFTGLSGCSSNTQGASAVGGQASCPAGGETCPCYGNDTCNAGLTCASHLCVRLATGGAPSTGGTPAINSSTTGSTGSLGGAPSTGGTSAIYSSTTGGTGSLGGAPSTAGSPGVGGSVGGGLAVAGGISVLTPALSAAITSSACAGWSSQVNVPPALLEFVVDTSGSMTDIPRGAAQSKWQITQAVLANAINSGLPDNAGVGMLFFPNMNTVPNHNTTPIAVNNCVNTSAMIPAAPLGAAGSTQRTALAQGLASAYVAGGTPTEDAYEYAYSAGLVPAKQTYSYLVPNMILITDGQPTIALGCEGTGQTAYPVDWHPLVTDVTTVFQSTPTVRTFIVGSPGSEAQSSTGADGRPWLSQAARVGGTQLTPDCQDNGPNYCHFDLTQSQNFATDLAAALKNIIDSTMPCSVQISPPGGVLNDPNSLNVVYSENVVGGTPTRQWLVGQTTDLSCGAGTLDGWYADLSNGKVMLCPKTCKTVHGDKYARIDLLGGCQSVHSSP
jgi:hypothetical protein